MVRNQDRFAPCHSVNFLETLQPFDTDDHTKIANYLYDRSKEIEPKNCKKPPIKVTTEPQLPAVVWSVQRVLEGC
ncbi:hypothetical protein E2C01_047418 [Portunus trituberculatus]|uniref:Uncharacterized protein n=1 Tax=Portunus trituberculatus TaxID=210409 RepID=A0A5B7G8H5_PORTR|nr:hypothetical protein [Portunus trituberculatus]